MQEIAHRDIKLENVLLTAEGSCRLCDFGSAVQGSVSIETAVQRAEAQEVIERTTTQLFRAPEMADLFAVRSLGVAVDIWALGCIAYTLAYLKHPFQVRAHSSIGSVAQVLSNVVSSATCTSTQVVARRHL